MPEAPTSPEFRIGEGGLLHRVERVAHLTSLRRQIITVVAATWLPLLVVGAVTELVTDREAPLLRDLAVHVRFLVATPVFLILDHVFPRSCRNALNELVASSFVAPEAEPRFEQLIRRATRVADSSAAELLLAALAMALGLLGAAGLVPLGGLGRGTPLTAVQLWYALIGWPMFQFLLWRSLWRWAIWAAILYGLSRLRLRLVPTHPDRHGGLGFLTLPSNRYCALLLFALSSVLCAEWGTKLAFSSAVSFEPLLFAFVAAGALLSFGPLLLFVPQLDRARLAGLTQCGIAASEYGRRFERHGLSRGEVSLLGEGSPVALAQMGVVFRENVDRMRPVLVDTRGLVVLLVATLLPVVPLMLAHVPREDWSILLKMLTGGRLP
jgi:hypothetical protein